MRSGKYLVWKEKGRKYLIFKSQVWVMPVQDETNRIGTYDMFKFSPFSILDYYFVRYSTPFSALATLILVLFSFLFLVFLILKAHAVHYSQEVQERDTEFSDFTNIPTVGIAVVDAEGNFINDSSLLVYSAEQCVMSSSFRPLGEALCTEIELSACTLYGATSYCPSTSAFLKGSVATNGFSFVRLLIKACQASCDESSSEILYGSKINVQVLTSTEEWAEDLLQIEDSQYAAEFYVLTEYEQTNIIFFDLTYFKEYYYFYSQFRGTNIPLPGDSSLKMGDFSSTEQVYMVVYLVLAPTFSTVEYFPVSAFLILAEFGSLVAFLAVSGTVCVWYNKKQFQFYGDLEWANMPRFFSQELLKTNLRNHFHFGHARLRFCTICETDQQDNEQLSKHVRERHPEAFGRDKGLVCEYCVLQYLNDQMEQQCKEKKPSAKRLQSIHHRIQRMKQKIHARS